MRIGRDKNLLTGKECLQIVAQPGIYMDHENEIVGILAGVPEITFEGKVYRFSRLLQALGGGDFVEFWEK